TVGVDRRVIPFDHGEAQRDLFYGNRVAGASLVADRGDHDVGQLVIQDRAVRFHHFQSGAVEDRAEGGVLRQDRRGLIHGSRDGQIGEGDLAFPTTGPETGAGSRKPLAVTEYIDPVLVVTVLRGPIHAIQ